MDDLLDMYPSTASKIPDTSFSTGRTTWNNLDEQLAMQKVLADPLEGSKKIINNLSDPNLPGNPSDWAKHQTVVDINGNKISIHFDYNSKTGQFLDFKFQH